MRTTSGPAIFPPMKIYFAGSIRGGRHDAGRYLEIIRELQQYGQVFTEHVGNSELDSNGESLSDREIYDRDLSWLEESNCLVAEVTTPSLGVGYEIAFAENRAKPILCLFRTDTGRKLSALIAGSPAVTVSEYRNLSEIKSIIAAFFAGLRQIEQ
jgi:hypothetical protein